MTFTSNQTGRYEVHVARVEAPSERWRVSRDGGAQPRWRADGREIVFIAPDMQLMSAAVEETRGGFRAELPARLMDLRWVAPEPYLTVPYTMTRDAQRFLIGTLVRELGSAPVTVVVNWPAALRRGPPSAGGARQSAYRPGDR